MTAPAMPRLRHPVGVWARMRVTRITAVLLAGALAVTGAVMPVVAADPGGAPVDELGVLLVVAAYAGVGVVVSLARPGHPVGWLLLAGAVVWGAGEALTDLAVQAVAAGEAVRAGWPGALGTTARGLGWLLVVLGVPLLFPDGRSPWRGRSPVVLAAAAVSTYVLSSLLAPAPLDSRLTQVVSPTGLPPSGKVVADTIGLLSLLLIAATLVVAVAGLVHRWRTGDELLRQQVLGFAMAAAVPLLLLPVLPLIVVEPWMFALVSLPLPVMIGATILQHRLYDVQLVLNRTLTYAALSSMVAGVYALTVVGAGLVMSERGAPWLPWVAAGVVGVSFTPLRDALQRAVNRLIYGQWSEPADVLAATGRKLSDAADGPRLLQLLVEELGSSLDLAHVEVVDASGRVLAVHGERRPVYDETSLSAYGDDVGSLRWSPPAARAADRRLLTDLASQIGGVVHSVGLVKDLRQAQQRLVLAREEERRRLRRDLHDGLGAALAGLTLQVDTVRNLLAVGRDAEAQLLRLRAGVASTVLDVRRIVEGLRPPALDELRLDGALAELADRLTVTAGLPVHVRMPSGDFPAIPAAVEVAAYRITEEALTNAVRHSGARRCTVALDVEDAALRLEVADDGCGQVQPRPGGIGLPSMHERAAELDGRLEVQAVAGHGTTVTLWLPCPRQGTS